MKPSFHLYSPAKKHQKILSSGAKSQHTTIEYRSSNNPLLNNSSPEHSQKHPTKAFPIRGQAKKMAAQHANSILYHTQDRSSIIKKAAETPNEGTHYQISSPRNLPIIASSHSKKQRVLLSISSTNTIESKPLIRVSSLRAPFKVPQVKSTAKAPLSTRGEASKFSIQIFRSGSDNFEVKGKKLMDQVLGKLRQRLNMCKQRENLLISENTKLKSEVQMLKQMVTANNK